MSGERLAIRVRGLKTAYGSHVVHENLDLDVREGEVMGIIGGSGTGKSVPLSGLEASAANKYPSDLSGGMRKRAALARALALDPALLFLDEPTAGLDPITAGRFDQLIRDLQQSLGLTVFLVTHDLDTLGAICDRISVIAEKRIIATGTIAELRELDHPWINEYFNGPRGRAAVA